LKKPEKNKECWEEYLKVTGAYKGKIVEYSYRDSDGKLYTCRRRSLRECRVRVASEIVELRVEQMARKFGVTAFESDKRLKIIQEVFDEMGIEPEEPSEVD